jgi:hypothetical protein
VPGSFDITRDSITQTGYNATDEYANAVCLMRNFRLRLLAVTLFSHVCEDSGLEDEPNIFGSDRSFIKRFSHNSNYHDYTNLAM